MPRLSAAYQAVLRSYVDSRKVNSVPWAAEALYIRLLCVSDGQGRYRGDAHHVACHAASERLHGPFPIAGDSEVEELLAHLERVGLLSRYQVDGETFLQLEGYFDAGNRQRATYPAPDGAVPQAPRAAPPEPSEAPDGEPHPIP